MKNSFILYHNYKEHFDLLSDDELGKLMRTIFDYEMTGRIPEMIGGLRMAFSFIKKDLDQNKVKWENTAKRNQKNIKKRWSTGIPNNTKNTSGIPKIPGNTKNTVNVNVNVNEDVNDNTKNSSSRKLTFSDNDMQLANIMFTKILQLNPTNKKPNLEKWADEFRKILKIDKKPASEVLELLELIFKDSFWCNNILSPNKLRKQYDQLKIKLLNNRKPIPDWHNGHEKDWSKKLVKQQENSELNKNIDLTALAKSIKAI